MKMTIKDTHPEILKQWIDDGDGRSPAGFTHGSHEEFLWGCPAYESHRWRSKIKVRTSGHGCPYCANRIVLSGFNDLATKIPLLASQWDYEKNESEHPENVLFTSSKKYWWICNQGHSIYATIRDRKSKKSHEYNACAACSGRIAVKGVNDLYTLYPHIAQQCISDVDTASITAQSSRVLEWRCENNHTMKESPRIRVKRVHSCPTCQEDVREQAWIKREKDLLDLKSYEKKLSKERKEGLLAERAMEKYEKKKKNFLSHKNPELFSELLDGELNSDVTYNSAKKLEWQCNYGHTWKAAVYQRYNFNSQCPTCMSHTYTSKGEKSISDFIKTTYKGEIIENTKSLISPYEVDIYLPEKNMAIEFNGLYWHSDMAGKNKSYHYDKWILCAEKGVQLITVWEDDWRDRPEIVKSMLSHKLGVSDNPAIFARNTVVHYASKKDAFDFCKAHHIQGYVQGSQYIGLKDKSSGEIVAMSIWRKNKESLYLERYCTSQVVIGGMGKLLKAGRKFALDAELLKIVTFSDHEVSNGNLYKKLGFVKEKEIRPDYKYVIQKNRVHKFNYRLKRFKNDPDLLFEEGLSESELAQLNKIPKVYDCGKTRWIMLLR